MEYPKINSLWKRQGYYFDPHTKSSIRDKNTHDLIVGDYSMPEFKNIREWHVEEKIDGTNIRIFFQKGAIRFGGRTKDAQIPCHLFDYLQGHFTIEKLKHAFPADNDEPYVILFGEGYGPKINSGGNYRDDVGFILFDVFCGGWWLKREAVRDIAISLGILNAPPIGVMEEFDIVTYVKRHPQSLCSVRPQIMEGVVCRPEPLMLFRDEKPIMFKLKCKDFT